MEEVGRHDAVRLFLARAAAVQPPFALDANNVSAIVQLCHRLDGVPLAIELAAAWLQSLAVHDLVSRVDRCLPLLTRGSRTALPRQQTIRASIDWSYDLLTASERTFFRRLSVFGGSFTLDAAEAIAGAAGIKQDKVMDLLAHLVDKSLVAPEVRREKALRYRLLEMLRQYGRERLDWSGEAAAVAERHAVYYLALAEQATGAMHGSEQVRALDRLEMEHDNLRASLGWLLEQRDAERSVQLVDALGALWQRRHYNGEGRGWVNRVLLLPEVAAQPQLRAIALRLARVFAAGYPEAAALLAESVALSRAVGARRNLAATLVILSTMLSATRRDPAVRCLLTESLALFRGLGDEPGSTAALNGLGLQAMYSGDYRRAQRLLTESLTIARRIDDVLREGALMWRLGRLAMLQGNDAEAQQRLEQSVPLYTDVMGEPLSNVLSLLRELAARRGDDPGAATYLEEALEQARSRDQPVSTALALEGLGRLARRQGDEAEARRLLRQCLELSRECGHMGALLDLLYDTAEGALLDGQAERALRLLAATAGLQAAGHAFSMRASPARSNLVAGNEHVAALRETLNVERFATIWAEGQRTTANQALALALEESCDPMHRHGKATRTPAPTRPPGD